MSKIRIRSVNIPETQRHKVPLVSLRIHVVDVDGNGFDTLTLTEALAFLESTVGAEVTITELNVVRRDRWRFAARFKERTCTVRGGHIRLTRTPEGGVEVETRAKLFGAEESMADFTGNPSVEFAGRVVRTVELTVGPPRRPSWQDPEP